MGTIKKPGKIKHLGLRLPPDLHERLVEKANADRRTLNDEVIVLLEKALKLKD
jgi:predicted HicB family RNase H-like nuclease